MMNAKTKDRVNKRGNSCVKKKKKKKSLCLQLPPNKKNNC